MSVASRKAKGVVTVYDDFRYKSKSYYNIRRHFRSLDSWLDGICESHCDMHPKTGKSIKKKSNQIKNEQ